MDTITGAVSEVLEAIIDNVVEATICENMQPCAGIVADPSELPGTSTNIDDCDSTCAICLEPISDTDLAIPVAQGCKHAYCVTCLVHWASTRSKEPRCPSCKMPFTKILCSKLLDGTISEVPVEESVSLLARSAWFQTWLSAHEHMKHLSRMKPGVVPAPYSEQPVHPSEQALMQEEWAEEELYTYFEDMYDDDDVEHMYLTHSRGPRHAFSNRPWGPNGFVAAGRKLAAPKRPPTGKGKGKDAQTLPRKSEAGTSGMRNNCYGSVKANTGRRAQRKAKRAAADAAT